MWASFACASLSMSVAKYFLHISHLIMSLPSAPANEMQQFDNSNRHGKIGDSLTVNREMPIQIGYVPELDPAHFTGKRWHVLYTEIITFVLLSLFSEQYFWNGRNSIFTVTEIVLCMSFHAIEDGQFSRIVHHNYCIWMGSAGSALSCENTKFACNCDFSCNICIYIPSLLSHAWQSEKLIRVGCQKLDHKSCTWFRLPSGPTTYALSIQPLCRMTANI